MALFGWQIKLEKLFTIHGTQITRYNPMREVLIVDVLTKEGSIYSGVLTGWVPGNEGVQSISLQYILRFLPEMEKTHGNESAKGADRGVESPVSTENGKEEKASGSRKKVLLKNNGELTLPGCELCTIHIWEIRRSFVAEGTSQKSPGLECREMVYLDRVSVSEVYF